MNALQSMCDKMAKTGLYHLGVDNLVYKELAAYAEGLDILYDAFEELFRECFVSTAEDYGLTIREGIINKLNLDQTVEGRRKSVLAALSIANTDNRVAAYEKYPTIFNVNGEFTEDFENKKIIFHCTDGITSAQKTLLEKQMKEYMPCWLAFEVTT